MKLLLKIFILLTLAIIVAFFTKFDNGHIVLFLRNYRFDMTFSLFCASLVILFILIYYLIRFMVNIHRIPNKIRRWQQNHALLTSRKYLNNAGINFFEGKYGKAYKHAVLSVAKEKNAENKFLGLMLAFKSSNYMRNYVKESEILDELDKFQQQKWQLAKLMTLSENMYNAQKYNPCLDNLNLVLGIDKKHIPATRLLLKTYLRLENYSKAYSTLTWLVKNDYLEPHRAENSKIRVFKGLFSQINDADELNNIYKKLDKEDKNSLLISKFYFTALIRLEDYASCIEFVSKVASLSIFVGFEDDLISLAKRLKDNKQVQELFKICEKLLADNKSSSRLHLALGILSYALTKFGEAKTYLEESIRLQSSFNAYLYLMFVAKSTENDVLLANVLEKLELWTRSANKKGDDIL